MHNHQELFASTSGTQVNVVVVCYGIPTVGIDILLGMCPVFMEISGCSQSHSSLDLLRLYIICLRDF